MPVRPIVLYPDPILRRRCPEVETFGDDVAALARDLADTMYDAPGLGLAAPQVGVLSRLIVLDCVKEEGAAPRPTVMFNPEVLASSDEMNVYEEGCLSIPDQYAEVTRPAEVRVAWIDRDGNPRGG